MVTDSLNCGYWAGIAKAFSGENSTDLAINGAIVSCCVAVFSSAFGVLTGAELLGDVFAGISLFFVVCFVVAIFTTDKSLANQSESFSNFMDEHPYAKDLLEE